MLLVALLVFVLAASVSPTPIYPLYQAEWGFSPVTLTAIFGSYSLMLLAALLTIGGLSDHVGRRPMLFIAVALQIVALVLYLIAADVTALFIARMVQGLSAGAALGAIGGGLLDLDRIKGTLANATASTAGNGLGALTAGLFASFLPAPTRLIYGVLLVIVIVLGIGLFFLPETSSPRPGALASLRPHLVVPSYARTPFIIAFPTYIATSAIIGFYGALGPAVAREVSGSSSAVLGGLTLFALTGAAAIAILITRNGAPIRLQMGGSVALMLGVAITEASLRTSSLTLLLVGTAVAGAGLGPAAQGAMRTVLPLARTHDRAGLVSAIFVVTYLAMSVPVLVAGMLIIRGGLLATAGWFGAAVMLLAGLPLVAGVVRRGRAATPPAEQDAVGD